MELFALCMCPRRIGRGQNARRQVTRRVRALFFFHALTHCLSREVQVVYNVRGHGPEQFVVKRVKRTNTLLKHTTQLEHESEVQKAWEYFETLMKQRGYTALCTSDSSITLKDHVKIQVERREEDLSDRLRIVNLRAERPVWLQMDHVFDIPLGTCRKRRKGTNRFIFVFYIDSTGIVTFDAAILRRIGTYRAYLERRREEPVEDSKPNISFPPR